MGFDKAGVPDSKTTCRAVSAILCAALYLAVFTLFKA